VKFLLLVPKQAMMLYVFGGACTNYSYNVYT